MSFFTNYPMLFRWFKRLPIVNSIFVFLFSMTFGILDAVYWFTEIGWVLEFWAAFIWPSIGIVAAITSGILTAIFISPIVIVVDTISETKLADLYEENTKSAV